MRRSESAVMTQEIKYGEQRELPIRQGIEMAAADLSGYQGNADLIGASLREQLQIRIQTGIENAAMKEEALFVAAFFSKRVLSKIDL